MHEPSVIILAAGQGKRMHSDLPKVLHPVLYRPMLHYVLDVAKALTTGEIIVVVGHGEDKVRAACQGYEGIKFARQEKQLGTADAVRSAGTSLQNKTGPLLVLSGDVMLLQKETLKALFETHKSEKAAATLLTADLDNPTGYGRILREASGGVTAIREQADCTEAEKKTREVNSGIYCFDTQELFQALDKVSPKNAQGEFYLTDVVSLLVASKKKVMAQKLSNSKEMTGVNDRAALSEVEGILKERTNRALMLSGVSIPDPASTVVSPDSQIAPDVRIEPGAIVVSSRVAKGSVIEAYSRVQFSTLEEGAHIKQGSYIESSVVGKRTTVGPYAHLRPESRLGEDVKIGNFVEIKKATFDNGAKASHLSYIGDAEIGKNVNLGCGFVTCNYDGGPKKHRTIIEDGVFIGSDSQTVAPVVVGKNSYIASGSTITENVPADSLALSRGRQITKVGYAKKYKK